MTFWLDWNLYKSKPHTTHRKIKTESKVETYTICGWQKRGKQYKYAQWQTGKIYYDSGG